MSDAQSDAYRAQEEEEEREAFYQKNEKVEQMEGLFAQLAKVREEKRKLIAKEKSLLKKIHKYV